MRMTTRLTMVTRRGLHNHACFSEWFDIDIFASNSFFCDSIELQTSKILCN